MTTWTIWLSIVAPVLLVACTSTASPPAPQQPSGSQSAPAQSGQAAPARTAQSEALQTLIEAARKEGQLNFVWGEASMGGGNGVRRMAESFNKAYGLNLNVQFTPGPSISQMVIRLLQEYQAGRPASSDVFLATESHIAALIEADALDAINWTTWAPNIQNPKLVAPGGGAVQTSVRAKGMTYNSNRLRGDAVPTSMQDVLKPQYKGNIAAIDSANVFEYLASPQMWGRQRVVEYASQFRDQVAGIMRCGEGERLVSGEFDLFVTDCGAQDSLRWQAKGGPLAHVIPSDAATLSYQYMGLLKNSAHPNAAKLWINHMLSREGQELVFEFDYADHLLLPGSKVAPAIEAAQARGVKFTEVDVQFFQSNDTNELRRVGAEALQFVTGAR